MSRRPLCRVCGKPIAKATTAVGFGVDKPTLSFSTFRPEQPTTLAEARQLVNGEILSVRRGYGDRSRVIVAANVWDGVSYVDANFDTGSCAAQFGRAMAEQFATWSFPAYREARKAQSAREVRP